MIKNGSDRKLLTLGPSLTPPTYRSREVLTQVYLRLVPWTTLILPDTVRLPSEGLIESIRDDGLITPLLVISTDQGFLICKGTRRYLAIQELRNQGDSRWELIPVEEVDA